MWLRRRIMIRAGTNFSASTLLKQLRHLQKPGRPILRRANIQSRMQQVIFTQMSKKEQMKPDVTDAIRI